MTLNWQGAKIDNIHCYLGSPGGATYIHIYIHTYVHTYVRTYIRTYIHAYIRTCQLYVRDTLVVSENLYFRMTGIRKSVFSVYLKCQRMGGKRQRKEGIRKFVFSVYLICQKHPISQKHPICQKQTSVQPSCASKIWDIRKIHMVYTENTNFRIPSMRFSHLGYTENTDFRIPFKRF